MAPAMTYNHRRNTAKITWHAPGETFNFKIRQYAATCLLILMGYRGAPSVKKAVTRKMHVTPVGRYFFVKGRLWRCTNPSLAEEKRTGLVNKLMNARREKGTAMRRGDTAGREAARQRIDDIKTQLGERRTVWWSDGAPDWNRHMAKNTPYAEWFARVVKL